MAAGGFSGKAMQGETMQVLQEEGVSAAEMEQQLQEFLRKTHVTEKLGSNELTRLQGLQKALKREAEGNPPIKPSHS